MIRKENIKIYRKEYNRLHQKEMSEYSKKYHQEHKEEISNRKKEYYQNHKEKIKENIIRYREENKDYIGNYQKTHQKEIKKTKQKYYLFRKSEILKQNKKYSKTAKGKTAIRKTQAKRRQLDFIELNEHFNDSEAHHIDKEFVLYIPRELHRSVFHNVWTGKGMEEINEMAIEWVYGI